MASNSGGSSTSSVIGSRDDVSMSSLGSGSSVGSADLGLVSGGDDDKFEVISLNDYEWRYRGEGGANLVISLPEIKKVVRFSKSKYVDKDHDSKVRAIAHYANNVMMNALGRDFVKPLAVCSVFVQDVQRVKEEIRKLRPPFRLNKDIAGGYVVVSHDCVYLTKDLLPNTTGDTVCVEIKPKQGYLSVEDSQGQKIGFCHRCLKQQSSTGKASNFCPLDLYSGQLSRMKKAIHDLFDSPQNWLKVFKDGRLLFAEGFAKSKAFDYLREWLGVGSEDGALNVFATLICKTLLDNDEVIEESELNLKAFKKNVKSSGCLSYGETRLNQSSVLGKLLGIQLENDINESRARRLCEELLRRTKANMEELHQVLTWTSCKAGPGGGIAFDRPGPLMQPCLPFSPSDLHDFAQLQKFLLSVTAKDVSILLTFRKILRPELETGLPKKIIPDIGLQFRTMISVIDLDPKPVNRIKTWIRKKEEMLKAYEETNGIL